MKMPNVQKCARNQSCGTGEKPEDEYNETNLLCIAIEESISLSDSL